MQISSARLCYSLLGPANSCTLIVSLSRPSFGPGHCRREGRAAPSSSILGHQPLAPITVWANELLDDQTLQGPASTATALFIPTIQPESESLVSDEDEEDDDEEESELELLALRRDTMAWGSTALGFSAGRYS